VLRITAGDLRALGIVDGVLPESGPAAVEQVRTAVSAAIDGAVVGDRDRRTATATARVLRAA
jgi:acetyl-CoA carboxylase alpha subunit